MTSHKSRTARALFLAALFDLFFGRLGDAQTLQILHDFFLAGTMPLASVIQLSDGALYGTTFKGGFNSTGTVFRVQPDGSQFRILHSFGGTSIGDGYEPIGRLTAATDGNLYGTAHGGGQSGLGTVFKISPDGSQYQTIYSFGGNPHGSEPYSGLIQGQDSDLYGTTREGGMFSSGTVFRVSLDGSHFQILHSFDPQAMDGTSPEAELIQTRDGKLCGTTLSGASYGSGSVFCLAPDGSGYQIVHSFNSSVPNDGASPLAALLQLSDGDIVGTTQFGGASNAGTLFRISSELTNFQLIHSFLHNDLTSGEQPVAPLIEGNDGYLYGTTRGGGTAFSGMAFRIQSDGTAFEVLHLFDGNDGQSSQAPLFQGAGGTLFGTTAAGSILGSGTVFRIDPDGSFASLFSFGANDGWYPSAPILLAADGNLYGSTLSGGVDGAGTVFRLGRDGSGFEVLQNFPANEFEGGALTASLIEASDGYLYGTSENGGGDPQGIVFRIARDGSSFHLMASIADPKAPVLQGQDGQLYGIASGLGAHDSGYLFRLDLQGNEQTIYSFTSSPAAGLIQGPDGSLYGTTAETLFKIQPNGSGFQTLHDFGVPGVENVEVTQPLLLASDGNLYGTTGTVYEAGTIFSVGTDGRDFRVLHVFPVQPSEDGFSPDSPLIEGRDGFIYGTTAEGGADSECTFDCSQGTIFAMAKDGSSYQVVYSFSEGNSGWPTGIVQGPDGAFYGAAKNGGAYNAGTVFRFVGAARLLPEPIQRQRKPRVLEPR